MSYSQGTIHPGLLISFDILIKSGDEVAHAGLPDEAGLQAIDNQLHFVALIFPQTGALRAFDGCAPLTFTACWTRGKRLERAEFRPGSKEIVR